MKLGKLDSLIIYTKHLTLKEAQKIILEDHNIQRSLGFISAARLRLRDLATQILYEEAKHFPDKHVTRLSTLSYLLEKSFENLRNEESPVKRQSIIDSIVALQYDISSFDEATKSIIEVNIVTPKKEEKEITTGDSIHA